MCNVGYVKLYFQFREVQQTICNHRNHVAVSVTWRHHRVSVCPSTSRFTFVSLRNEPAICYTLRHTKINERPVFYSLIAHTFINIDHFGIIVVLFGVRTIFYTFYVHFVRTIITSQSWAHSRGDHYLKRVQSDTSKWSGSIGFPPQLDISWLYHR